MSTRSMSVKAMIAGAAMVGGLLSIAAPNGALAGPVGFATPAATGVQAPVDTVGWRRCHWGWHCHGYHHHVSPYFTRMVDAGVVSYPIHRVERYHIDYRNPSYTLTSCCTWW